MDKERAVTPLAWLVLGAVVTVFGIGYIYDGTEPLGVVCTIAGAGLLLFGLIAQAVKVGVSASREPD